MNRKLLLSLFICIPLWSTRSPRTTTLNSVYIVPPPISLYSVEIIDDANAVRSQENSTLNAVARYADTSGLLIKNSSVLVDDVGNVQLNGITKNGNTITWPSNIGALGTFLGSDGAGNLIYSTPSGAGNVSTALSFTTDNSLITTDTPSGNKNIKQAGVTLDESNNISGVNILNATTVNANLTGTATAATSVTGPFAGDVTGTQSATVVSAVGGQIAANVALATIAANAATSNNMPNTIVQRDGAGNFNASMISLSGTISSPTDVTTKEYVDAAVSAGLKIKYPALVTSTSDLTLSGTQTVDDVTLAATNRILLVGQTNPIENGLWLVQTGAWTRPADFSTGTEAGAAYVLTTSGTINAGTSWVCTTTTAIIDTDPINMAEFSLPGQTTAANVGTGAGQIFRDKIGQTINLKTLAAGIHMIVTNNTNDITLTTDATSANTPSTIVLRDGSGNFNAGIITAALTGAASQNVLKAGDTMTGALTLPAGSAANPSLQFTGSTNTGFSAATANTISCSSNGTEKMTISDAIQTQARFALGKIICNQAIQTAYVGTNSATIDDNTSILIKYYNGDTNFNITFPAAPHDGQLITIIAANESLTSGTLYLYPNSYTIFAHNHFVTSLNPDVFVASPSGSYGGTSVSYVYSDGGAFWFRCGRG